LIGGLWRPSSSIRERYAYLPKVELGDVLQTNRRKIWCQSCGRQFRTDFHNGLGCPKCSGTLTLNPSIQLISQRAQVVSSYTDHVVNVISRELGITHYFALMIIMSNAHRLYPTDANFPPFLKEQDLYDYLADGNEEHLTSFMEKFQRVLQIRVDRWEVQRYILPDIYSILDAGGRRVKYSEDEFFTDLEQFGDRIPELANFATLESRFEYLCDLFIKVDYEKFRRIVYNLYDTARQTHYWGEDTARSIITVGSKMGRRAPGWGWN